MSNIEEKIAYLELCVEEAKSRDWADGIGFALSVIQDDSFSINEERNKR